jgi:putative ATP-dependent endonuclease of OLD family
MLEDGDYRFLERFLDVTKANLFFAHGVIIVEGDAEALLLPVLARLLGTDLTEHGVSIVNVGGRGLRRFSNIFKRFDDKAPQLAIPIACLADMDVMPDCAPEILELVAGDDDEKWNSGRRRWKAIRDFGDSSTTQEEALNAWRQHLQSQDGQAVRTFVSDYWTLEYDLAFCGLAQEVHLAACLALAEDRILVGAEQRAEVEANAQIAFAELEKEANGDESALCARIFKLFHSGGASKTITAQYLAETLDVAGRSPHFDRTAFAAKLPRYIQDAVAHVRNTAREPAVSPDGGKDA